MYICRFFTLKMLPQNELEMTLITFYMKIGISVTDVPNLFEVKFRYIKHFYKLDVFGETRRFVNLYGFILIS